MITETCQRWSFGRCRWRPAREGFDRRAYEVAPLPRVGGRRLAAAFLREHHYLRTLPSVRALFGLHARGGALVGLAVLSNPSRDEVLAPFSRDTGTCLGRLALLDEVPGNAESWFVARCFELLAREGVAGVVSFSDPMPRTTLDGRQTTPGHVGRVYQGLGAAYLGRSRAERIVLLPDATAVHRRSLAKIRAADSRWRSAARPILAAGAPAPEDTSAEGLRAWVDGVLPRLTREVEHPGNHKYAWALDAAAKRLLPASRAYPRFQPPTCPVVTARAS